MRVLVTFGSRMGGTAGIAGQIDEVLRRAGLEVVLLPAKAVRSATLADVDAAVRTAAMQASQPLPEPGDVVQS